MTELYQRHATRKDKSRNMKLYPDILKLGNSQKMIGAKEANCIDIQAESIISEKDAKLLPAGIMADIQALLLKADEKQLKKILTLIDKVVKT